MTTMDSNSVDILHLPLEKLAALSMQRLKDNKILERAAKSVLYREKWKAADVRVEEILTYEDFAKIPFVTGQEVRKAINENPIEKVLCSDAVVHWFSTSGSTGMPKWIPYSQKDIDLFIEVRDRGSMFVPSAKGLKCLAVSSPAPFVENALSAFERFHGMMINMQREGVDVCLTEVEQEDAINFALDMKPNFIAASPSFAVRFAEIIEEKAPEVTRKRFIKERSIRNLVAYLVTRVKKIRPKDLSEFKWGLFGGEPLDPYREVIRRFYDLEPYEFYMFTEFMCPAAECYIHNGMHVWMDVCLPEVIPEYELEEESRGNAYTPKAIPLWKAERGLRGEYVVTTFAEALPLVRYRTRDLVVVIGTEPCQCGITHPRIKVPRRIDTTICLGLIRFPAEQLEEKLLAKTEYGKAQRWQLKITREGYWPKLIIRVEPSEEITNRELFLKEISKRLRELKILRTGIENKVVAEPVVLLEERISDEGRPVAKAGRVIYEDEDR